MENLLLPQWFNGHECLDFIDGNRAGWVAARTIADVAATVLREGPTKHHGKDYYLSTQVFTASEIAGIVGQATRKKITVAKKDWRDFGQFVKRADPWFAKALTIQKKQEIEGRLPTLAVVRDDAPFITGKPSTTLQEWVLENRKELLMISGK